MEGRAKKRREEGVKVGRTEVTATPRAAVLREVRRTECILIVCEMIILGGKRGRNREKKEKGSDGTGEVDVNSISFQVDVEIDEHQGEREVVGGWWKRSEREEGGQEQGQGTRQRLSLPPFASRFVIRWQTEPTRPARGRKTRIVPPPRFVFSLSHASQFLPPP